MSKKLFVIIPALYKCGMFSGLIIVRHFIVIFGVCYNDPVWPGKNYAIVFLDYLTKWPEVFTTKDQTAMTIAKLFVQQTVRLR